MIIPPFRALLLTAAAVVAAPSVSAELLTADDPRIQAFENGLVDREDRGNPQARRWSIEERLAFHRVPGIGVAIIENSTVVWAKGYGLKQAGTNERVDADTVFSAGSVSKMINAALVLRMVAGGSLDLDTNVNQYLERWDVPDNGYTRDAPVTLRSLLAHTSGFSQHGFADFQPGEPLPSALQTLNGRSPAKHGPVHLMFTPGTRMDYSGGGITVSQVLIEDVSGMPYTEAARHFVFDPVGMNRSTFLNPLPAQHGNIAMAHDDNGDATARPRGWEAMPEMAASGLWVSARDLGAFVVTLMDSYHGTSQFLPRPLAQDMMNREPQSWHGLGPRINGSGKTLVFHHGGANNSYRARIEGHLETGQGIVLLTNGARGGWVYGEVRKAVEESFGWAITAEEGYTEPSF